MKLGKELGPAIRPLIRIIDDYIVSEFIGYYHERRPHQGLGNRLIGADEHDESPPVVGLDQVRCETWLGGLLKHYYRAA